MFANGQRYVVGFLRINNTKLNYMNTLRLEFEQLQKSKFNGIELMFETSNNKYIEWLEQKVVKNCNIPHVSKSF